jgi:AraC-like DNA-binding protein
MNARNKEEYPKVYLYRRIVQAKLYIDAHYEEALNLDNISDEAWFSKFHFIRLFKKAYNSTPHQYLMKVRIERSRELLKKGVPVSEACFAVGFESVSSFTALFKRLTGVTPSLYREQQIAQLSETQKTPLKFVPGCFTSDSEKAIFKK